MRKKDLVQFLVWWRNGSAFCISWFLVLWVLFNSCYGVSAISTEKLMEMIVLSATGVFLFCTFFTRLFLRNWRFLSRLTCFLIAVTIEECIAFYRLGMFVRTGSWQEWLIFVSIILGLYLGCILIYHGYSKRKGEIYTRALEQYQQKRSMEHGK